MINAQEWLDKNYPKENRSGIEEVHINEPNLEGELDLGDFTCKYGTELYFYPSTDYTRLKITNQPKYSKIIQLIDIQEWLDKEYLLKKREKTRKLDINNHPLAPRVYKKSAPPTYKQLTGLLNLTNFIALENLDCSFNKLISLDCSNCVELLKLGCRQNILTSLSLVNCLRLEEIDCAYNNFTTLEIDDQPSLKKLDCCNNHQLTTLVVRENKLSGDLDNFNQFVNLRNLDCSNNKINFLNISNCFQLEEIDCFNNQLINLDVSNCHHLTSLNCSNNLLINISLPTNPTNLKTLYLNDNNFYEQDLSFLVKATNLRWLLLENNKFTGSLNHLSIMKQLEKLNISNTDLNEVNLDKLPNSLRYIHYSTKLRPDCQLTAIIPQLDDWIWKNIHSDFAVNSNDDEEFSLMRKEWKELGFSKEEVREWIQVGAEPKDHKSIAYLRDNKQLSPQWALSNKEKFKEWQNRGDYEECHKCQQPNTSEKWCQSCAEKEWQEDIKNLDGQEIIEKFFQLHPNKNLKWIPYDQFDNIEYLAEGGFSKVYKARWGKDNVVALKFLTDSQNISLEFLTEIANNGLFDEDKEIVKCYGIAQDPQTKNYVMVMSYIEGGNLRQYLQSKTSKLNFWDKLQKLWSITNGLSAIHRQNLVHRDFHSGNIFNSNDNDLISDLGLSQPANYQNKRRIFGVLPYVAPEVLNEKQYTQASDIYSFGIVAYELFSNSYPYASLKLDDINLALAICKGLRPNINELKIPSLLKSLIEECWSSNPEQRPTASGLNETIDIWRMLVACKEDIPFYQQYQEIEGEYDIFSQNTPYKIYPTATVTSKMVDTKQIIKLLKTPQVSEITTSQLIKSFQQIKQIEEEIKSIKEHLDENQLNLVKEFIEFNKKLKKGSSNEEARNRINELDEKLVGDEIISEEEMEKIMLYCEKLTEMEKQEQLQANIETPPK